MSDLIKDSIDQAQNIALAGMKGGYEIAKRESAAKLAEKDAAIAELVEALHPFAIEFEIADAAGELQHWPPNEVKNCEAAWRAIRKHAQIMPNRHSHHDRVDFHDDKADGRPDMHVSTGPDDLGFDGKPVIR